MYIIVRLVGGPMNGRRVEVEVGHHNAPPPFICLPHPAGDQRYERSPATRPPREWTYLHQSGGTSPSASRRGFGGKHIGR